MMERFGMLTFPNGRRGAAIIDGDLVIHHCITSYWGADGPARDRFFAFNKHDGQLVWSSTPGTPPKDSSFSSPVLGYYNNKRVLYAGTGCGNLVAINARNGDPLWRYYLSYGGVNSSLLLHNNDKVIAIHGENLDSRRSAAWPQSRSVQNPPQVRWSGGIGQICGTLASASRHVYQLSGPGREPCLPSDPHRRVDLCDAVSGEELWEHKLENGQLHASPLYADGKLYVPMGNGNFYIPRSKRMESMCWTRSSWLVGVSVLQLWNGQMYIHTMEKLYCFGSESKASMAKTAVEKDAAISKGPVSKLQIIPPDVLRLPEHVARWKLWDWTKTDGWSRRT